jgi:uncharacterized membrane protein YczE
LSEIDRIETQNKDFTSASAQKDLGKAAIALKKTVAMLAGVFLSALGVSFSLKSGIGASPTGVCPAVFSPVLNITAGTGTGIQFILFLLVQIAILRKRFPPFQILQLAIAVLFGFLVDFTSNILAALPSAALWQQVLYSASGIALLAFGIFVVLKTDLLMLPPDAMISVIAQEFNKEYSKIKILLDCTLTIMALVGSLILYKGLVHVGIGTIAGAVLIGLTIGKLSGLKALNRWMDRAVGAK